MAVPILREICMLPLRPLLVIGTRPEAIKLAPVIAECRRRANVAPLVCLTGQHQELLEGVVDYFDLRPDYQLDAMRPGQGLAALTARLLDRLDDVLTGSDPDCVVVQGDTTSALAASLAAFYRQLPLVHVEAGLRTDSVQAPWPEEFNRRVASLAATLHCAPTPRAAANLLAAGVDPAKVHVTGNTVIDALLQTVDRERRRAAFWQARHRAWHGRQMVLITSHRRENLGEALAKICDAIAALAKRFPETAFVWPVHLNPQVQRAVAALRSCDNIHLLPPAAYPEFVWLMDRATLILTDSGGVQEEAPSLGKRVLVLRETTERPEAIECGAAELIGAQQRAIVDRVTQLLADETQCGRRRSIPNPFGDGQASQRIVDLLLAHVPASSACRAA
jgi:UDP-N-acetylglucosamine 2-epimerase (non-hydrolysing)